MNTPTIWGKVGAEPARYVDIHCHVLPGLDDGAAVLDDSVRIAREARGDGISTVVATPHVRADFPTTATQVARGVADVQRALVEQGIQVTVVSGGEIAVDRATEMSREELLPFCLGAGRYLLIEAPYGSWPFMVDQVIDRLLSDGFGVVVAHPERNFDVAREPELLRPLAASGVLFQLTASAVSGLQGRQTQRVCTRLIRAGLGHAIATDAHGHPSRPPSMAAAARALGDRDLAEWLCNLVPRAVVTDEAVPSPPRGLSSRPRTFLRWRRE